MWALPATTKTWNDILRTTGKGAIFRLTTDTQQPNATAEHVRTAAADIKRLDRSARIEWALPADQDPTQIPDANETAKTVDIIGLTVDMSTPWPTTMHNLNTWSTWAADHRRRIAIHATTTPQTRPGLIRSLNDWTSSQSKRKRVAYTALNKSPKES